MEKPINMIWANEAGVSVYIYGDENERRVIEIHGVINERETILATATIEKHNRNRMAQAFEYPSRTEKFINRYDISDGDLEELAKVGPIVKSRP